MRGEGNISNFDPAGVGGANNDCVPVIVPVDLVQEKEADRGFSKILLRSAQLKNFQLYFLM